MAQFLFQFRKVLLWSFLLMIMFDLYVGNADLSKKLFLKAWHITGEPAEV